uniref:Isoaspartyl peptidase/L-asparaginase n=1 Tax=Cyprinus carpio TaxID=7962 RepID=A0A8C1NEB4_CYPCA
MKSGDGKNNHPQTVGAVALDNLGKLAAATSSGGLVGKWKGRVGDTAIVGAGIYADEKLAVTCSGDGDAFLRQSVAHKVASLYNLKGYSLRQACREVIHNDLEEKCAGIIAVDHQGEAVIETNAGVMFVGSMVNGIPRTEVLRPMKEFSNVIWETNELVAHLQPNPLTPGATILTRKNINGPRSIFQLVLSDYVAMMQGARTVANLLCEKLGVHRCALVSMPEFDKPAYIKVFKWYHNLFQIQNTLFHSTVEYFNNKCKYAYTLTPITTDSISSPMGLGSNSEPVFVNMLGQDVYLADSMQFVLEYFMRFHEDLPGAYYVSPSFRGEDPDATHLNQFYHVECELLGDMNVAISIAEGYVAHLTQAMLKQHSRIILNTAGTVSHAQELLKNLEKPLSRVTLDQAIHIMPSSDCLEWVQEGQPQFGRKLTGKGERVLIEKYGGAVWLTEMDHLGVPFYQAYVEGSGRSKAKAAYLLLGLGETLGLGERHSTSEMVREALQHHAVPEDSYKWYINMRQVIPLLTSGWGMGTERYLCWLLLINTNAAILFLFPCFVQHFLKISHECITNWLADL